MNVLQRLWVSRQTKLHSQSVSVLLPCRYWWDPVVPVTTPVTSMTSLVLAALAAALIADFKSFLLALLPATYSNGPDIDNRFWDQHGRQSLPFVIIIIMLVFRGRTIPTRDHWPQKAACNRQWSNVVDRTIFLVGTIVFLVDERH